MNLKELQVLSIVYGYYGKDVEHRNWMGLLC